MSGAAVLLWQEIPENLSAENKKIHLKTDENKTGWLSGHWRLGRDKSFQTVLSLSPLSSPLLSSLSSLIRHLLGRLAWPGLDCWGELIIVLARMITQDHTTPQPTTFSCHNVTLGSFLIARALNTSTPPPTHGCFAVQHLSQLYKLLTIFNWK